MIKNDISGAPASNAGDEFHELWALREALRLLDPSTLLTGLQLEGVRAEKPADSEGPQWAGVDCTLYFGGLTIESAKRIEIVQLKYSVSSSNKKWSLPRICENKSKRGNNSVARRLGNAFKKIKELRGAESLESSLVINFVSNQPIHPDLLALGNSLAEGGELKKSAEKLRNATGLNTDDFSLFVRCLQLTGGENARATLRAEIIHTVSSFTDESAKHQVAQLRQEIVNLMLPEGQDTVVDAHLVLAWFGLAVPQALFPCEAKIEVAENRIQRAATNKLAKAVYKGGLVCLHGGGGCGKTTLLTELSEYLPTGSQVIIYDCYGAGRYDDPGAPRHRPGEAFTQLANEVSRNFGLPRFFALNEKTNHARAFRKRLDEAASALETQSSEALLVIAVDAADNAIAAAQRPTPAETCFVHEFVRFRGLPQNVRFVVSSRTSRKEALQLPRGTEEVDCPPFSPDETEAFVHTQWPDAPTDWIDQFHYLSYGNPRVQHTAMSGRKHPSEALTFLRPNGKSLEDVFRQLIDQAIRKSGDEAQTGQVCAALSVLPTPAPLDHIAASSGSTVPFVSELCQDLIPSVRILEHGIEFANEDFEIFVRNEGQKHQDEALKKAANYLADKRLNDPYAATYLFSIMSAAGRGTELFGYLEEKDRLRAIADPVLKRQVEMQRLRTIVAFCSSVGQLSEAIKTILIAAEATKISNEIEKLLAEEPDLSAAFAEENARRTILRNSDYRNAHGPLLMHLAAGAATQAERMPLAREYRRSANAWVQQRSQLPDHKEGEWKLSDNDIAMWADSVFLDAGPKAAVNFLFSWTPPLVRYSAGRLLLARIATREGSRGVFALSHAIPRTFRFMASIAAARAGKFPDKSVVERQLDDLRRLNLQEIELSREYLSRRSREGQLIDDVLLFCDIVATSVGVKKEKVLQILEDLWPTERRTYQKIITSDYDSIDFTLRVAALSSRIKEETFDFRRTFNIPENPDKEIEDEFHRRRAKELEEAITPIFSVYDAAANLITNGPSDAGEDNLYKALDQLNHNAYRFDRQLYGRGLRQCVSRRVADLCATGVIDKECALKCIKKAFADRDTFAESADEALRALSIDPDFHIGVLEAASQCADRIDSYRNSASEKVESYLNLARLILPISRNDASSFYQKAVAATREMDREAFDQIIFFAKTAAATRTKERYRRSISINLASFIEDAAVRLKDLDGFPWREAFQALAELDPNIALCALARWSDTGICYFDEGLERTILTMLSSNDIGAVEAVACQHLLRDTDQELIKKSIAKLAKTECPEANTVFDELSRLVLQDCSDIELLSMAQPILDGGSDVSADLSHLKELKELCKFLEEHKTSLERPPQNNSTQQMPRSDRNSEEHQVDLSYIDLTSPESIRTAVEESRKREYGRESMLLTEIQTHIPVPKRRDYLDALAELAISENYPNSYIDAIIAALGAWSSSSPSVRDWAHDRLPFVIKARLPRLISFVWHHEEQLQLLLEQAQFTPKETAILLLEGLQANADSFGPRGLYQLAAELMSVADSQEAKEVLEWYSRHQAGGVPQKDFSPIEGELVPREIKQSLAVFFYRFLGDVDVRLRWKAAHAVRALVRMGRTEVLQPLLDQVDKSEDFVYSAPNAPFHFLTALVWFAILMARLADEVPQAIAPLLPRLLAIATDSELPHVVLRYHLKKALETIVAKIPKAAKVSEKQTISAINSCSCRADKIKARHRGGMSHYDKRPSQRFHFDAMDTLPSWYDCALRIFIDVEGDEFLNIAERWIVDKWKGAKETSHWDREPRRGRYYESDYGLWSHRNGRYPTVERYWTYLEWHAMCCTVGDFLQARTCAQPEDGYNDDLAGWLRGWDITLPPVWLSDLRGSKPHEVRYWQPLVRRRKDWLDTVSVEEFIEELLVQVSSEKRFILDSHRSLHDYQYGDKEFSETVSVRSALVSGETASALVRALQIIDEPFDYGLPSEPDTRLEIKEPGFQLFSCITHPYRGEGLDRLDTQRRDMGAISAEPGTRLRKIESLQRNLGRTISWSKMGEKENVFRLETWSDSPTGYTDREQDRLNGQYCDGWRLSVKLDRLLGYLKTLKMDLIIEVQFEREKGDRYGRSRKEEAKAGVFDKLFILRWDGTIEDANGRIQAWPDDCS